MITKQVQAEHELEVPSGPSVADTLDTCTPDTLVPENVRVVGLVIASTGAVRQHDCYDEEGNADTMSGVMRRKNGELWLRMIDWARTDADTEVRLRWQSTGLAPEDINRISVFKWPKADPVRVFVTSD